MINDGGGRDGFAGTRWTLDKTDGLLEHAFDGVHLRVVQLRKAWSREAFGHLCAKDLRFQLVAKEFVILGDESVLQ